jgi:hypothetical protein
LFSHRAVVRSPLHGPSRAISAPALFAGTAQSQLTLRGVTQSTTTAGASLATIWFRFDRQLPTGSRPPSMRSMFRNFAPTAAWRRRTSSMTPPASGQPSSRKPVGAPGTSSPASH